MRFLLSGLVFLMTAAIPAAQRSEATPRRVGIYLTAADHSDKRLSLDGECKSKNYKLELHDSLHRAFVHVTTGSDRKRYEKSGLYGFQTCDGRQYRFVSSYEYEIREAGPIALYTLRVRSGRVTRVRHYFSNGPDGTVVQLTRENLKIAFPDSLTFHHSLDQTFRHDDELMRYDSGLKTYVVNRLFLAAESNK